MILDDTVQVITITALWELIRSTENILHWYHIFISIIFGISVPKVNAIFFPYHYNAENQQGINCLSEVIHLTI